MKDDMMRFLTSAIATKMGVKEMAVLFRLDKPCAVNVLAKMCGVTPAGATGILDRMEQRGLVKRKFSKKDRRRVMIKRTPEGDDLLSELLTHECS